MTYYVVIKDKEIAYCEVMRTREACRALIKEVNQFYDDLDKEAPMLLMHSSSLTNIPKLYEEIKEKYHEYLA